MLYIFYLSFFTKQISVAQHAKTIYKRSDLIVLCEQRYLYIKSLKHFSSIAMNANWKKKGKGNKM